MLIFKPERMLLSDNVFSLSSANTWVKSYKNGSIRFLSSRSISCQIFSEIEKNSLSSGHPTYDRAQK